VNYLTSSPGVSDALRGYQARIPDGSGQIVPWSEPWTATLLLGAGVDIRRVQELLAHRRITSTQIYDKRRIAAAEGVRGSSIISR
jgi:hypothetical protein